MIFNTHIYGMTTRKIAIVTGGSSGIGFAIAQKFIEHEYLTYIIGRNADKLLKAQHALGENCQTTQLDLEQLDQIPPFVQALIEKHGQIDVLVNNAGINLKKPFLEVSNAEFMLVLQTNLAAAFVLSREVATAMVPRKNGSIIHISSMAAWYGIPQVVAYAAAKAGLEGMTRAMAVELSPMGLRVNCVAPGYITTAMTEKAFNGDPERKRKVLSRTPMGKMGDPTDIANAVYFLCSESAGFITGETLKVDGGNAIGY